MRPSRAELLAAYQGRRVFVTGHTGFKGSWLTLWLHSLGADVTGYALAPGTEPALFDVAGVGASCTDVRGDVRDSEALGKALNAARPDYVFHLAAQPLVRRSYDFPLETLSSNVMGTAHLLEAVRLAKRPCAVVVVTSDKCYENAGQDLPLDEDTPMGGHDVYSMSKGATELIVSSYRRSFFEPRKLVEHGVALASGRAGNVVGGGDWAADRIVPDSIRALAERRPIPVRNPAATRPWQHVLEPLAGYLLLGAVLLHGSPDARAAFCEGWNFGPEAEGVHPVRDLAAAIAGAWGGGDWEDKSTPGALHEAHTLRLSIEKARARLGWQPRWGFDETMVRTTAWYRTHHEGADAPRLRHLCELQISDYMNLAADHHA